MRLLAGPILCRDAGSITRTLALILLIGSIRPACAAIDDVRVLGSTNTQAVLAYTAPGTAACTIEVSESASLSPLVHDVDSALFSGSNLDTRPGSAVRGRERVVVIGKRAVERAASGAAYSRALQAATVHHYRITCGADTAAGTFQTATIPLGNTYADEITPDPDNPGRALFQTPLYNRNATWIDPHTGALIRRVTQPGDHNYATSSTNALPSEVLSSANWTNPNNVLAEDSTNATYDGAACGTTCDWLMVNIPSTVAGYQLVERTDIITIKVRGLGSAASAADRTVEICPVQLGTTTIDPDGDCQEIVLPQSSLGTVSSTPRGVVDTWRKPGKPEWTTSLISTTHGHVRFALRKKTATGTISVDAIRRDWFRSFSFTNGSGSSYDRCSSVARNDDDGPRYLCNAFTGSSAGAMYSIHAETGNVRFLGLMYRPSTNYAMNHDHMMWDATNPNRFYSQPSGDPLGPQMFTYTGNGQEKSAGHRAEYDSAQILVSGGLSLTAGVKAFVNANASQYPFLFDDTKFVGCGPVEVQGDYLMLLCRRGTQDTFAWVAVYRISTQTIVAATPMFATPSARWCTQHYHDIVGNQGVVVEFTQQGKNTGVGNGYYITKLNGAINSTQTTIQVTSTCSGSTCEGHVDGEPVSATWADNYLMPAEVGDVFLVNNSEYIRIVQKNSPTEWVVQRNAIGGLGAKSHANNVDVLARCANKPGAGPTLYFGTPLWVWDYLGDPYGMDGTGQYAWMNPYPSHSASRLNFYVGHKSVFTSPEGTYAMRQRDPQWQIGVPPAPYFAGKYPPAGGNTWQHHPNVNQVSAPAAERRFFWDIQPFIGGNLILPTTATCDPNNPPFPATNGCAAARVSGLSNVYRLAITGSSVNEDGLNPKHLPLFGVGASNILRDVSGPGSILDDSPSKDYTLCYVVQGGECVSGSSPGQTYVQIPGLSAFYCTGGESYSGASDVCVSDFPMMGLSLGQYGIERNKDGVAPSLAPSPATVGAGWMRDVAKMGLRHSYRTISVFAAGRPLANGKWVLATDWVPGSLLALVKVPPVVKDTVNRSTFVPVPVRIGSVPRGTDNVVVEFGYAERGSPEQYRCTSRAESCVAAGAAVNEATPFFFASESYAGLPCASGCTVVIPAYPSRVVYYRVRYRDGGNQMLQQGPMEIAIAP
jgi:hypothetical protein